MSLELVHRALDAYTETWRDRDKCASLEVREIAAERDYDLSWSEIASIMAALEAAGVER
jgi:hypothetical protein